MNRTPPKHTQHIQHHLNSSKTKVAFSFQRSDRFSPRKTFSPNKFYDVAGSLTARAPSMGVGERTSVEKLDSVEPGRYTIQSGFDSPRKSKQKGYSFGIGRQDYYRGREDKNRVGPGAYKLKTTLGASSFYIGRKVQPISSKINTSSCSYQINQSLHRLSTYRTEAPCRMKTEYFPKTKLQLYDNKVPGPGAYSSNPGYSSQRKKANSTFGVGEKLKGSAPSWVGPGSQYSMVDSVRFFRNSGQMRVDELNLNKNITYMYEEEQEEEVKDPDADLPKFHIRHSDMKLQMVKLIVRKTNELIKEELKRPEPMLEKDICLKLVEYLRGNKADFGAGEGEWQCIIGKNLAATLNYDLHMLTFFDLTQYGYSILVFKSG